ncbi:MAG TPA: cytochrome b [Casimicrobiaceae bacterium]|nr:cytochrome b [Casimicrobiaceae bacterium]
MATSEAETSAARYSRTAVALHWLIAALFIGQFAWGWLMQEIPKSPPGLRADAFNVHKSIGLCLLGLMLFRLGWRIAHPPPALPALPAWQAHLARATHVALYVALLVQPLSGYLGSVWSGYPVKWFGITLPAWGAPSPELKDAMSNVHLVTSFVLLTLVLLHVAGALHHALRRDGIVSRMWFGTRTRSDAGARPPMHAGDRNVTISPPTIQHRG